MFPTVNGQGPRRRGTVAVVVAICLVTMLGFAALTVDVGAMYNARNDLQRSADSAALGAASRLSDWSTGDPLALATETATALVGENGIFNRSLSLDSSDIVFGRANYDSVAHTFTFVPTTTVPDAVRVNVRLADDSSNGPFSLFFANIFGRASTNVSAAATAMMVPRDIAIVADLSSSHTDDCEFRHYQQIEIKMWDTWNGLPGGYGEVGSVWMPADIQPGWTAPDGTVSQAAGPAWGFMKKMGFGDETIPTSYDPDNDPGLTKLTYKQNWTNADMSAYLSAQGYNAAEVNAIMSNGAADNTTSYPLRVATALGLAYWNSGLPGGRWSTVGAPPGNANTTFSSSELQWAETIMGRTPAQSTSIWQSYINYVRASNTTMYDANSDLRYQYGVKTFVNFILDEREQHSMTPELTNAPHQPMQAVKDATQILSNYLVDLDSNDQVSLEIYATTVRHEVDLTENFSAISARLNELHAGYYDSSTNTGGGIYAGIDELNSVRARPGAKKVIILLTDGIANVDESGNAGTDPAAEAAGGAYALLAANDAAAQGIRIFAVSVGSAANTTLMQQIADIGEGEHFHANGSIEEYSAELQSIFVTIGGRRPVALVE
jgi:Flp pilus assembly protein TadG